MSQGKCFTCHTPGPEGRTRNFLCTFCAHPDEVRIYCARCQTIAIADADTIEAWTERLPAEDKPVPGTSIRMDYCVGCQTPEQARRPPTVQVYGIATK